MTGAHADPVAWTVAAQNLPEHARNPIHTDEGARAAGFPAALVAGVTTYAYLTHPIVAAWGLDWVRSGGGEVRFRSPVHQGDVLTCAPRPDGDAVAVEGVVGDGPPRLVLRAWRDAGAPPAPRVGEPLRVYELRLDGEYGADYATKAGDDLALFTNAGVVHPAVWPALANHVVHRQLARGSWIHTRSVVRHHALAPAGATAIVRCLVVDRFVRSGERAVVDVAIEVGGIVVATLEHEAIIDVSVR